ncbi:tryptophan halogenase family protein [Paraferrimonas sp. SM1919]|uniref:tryptophan halogenase family protein n=1 Tax=Paraferrimonas sp. SM1919 TaxID=2662263 RepID=UPI0013D8755F|nr:tryptophan halogenase family protein [Paraferrimonas sp. SM1919]
MEQALKITIVGGGSAGWLSAGLIASQNPNVQVSLIESANIPTIGVGEGTWPSMRETLSKIGIDENQFLAFTNASFKQGSQFVNWHKPNSNYYHPFTQPINYYQLNLGPYWQPHADKVNFAAAVSSQVAVCDANLAPKTTIQKPYQGSLNYGYHLDAVKFAQLLTQHCTQVLKVEHIIGDVVAITNDNLGYIKQVQLECGNTIKGDLFIDCTGSKSLLLNKHYGVEFKGLEHVLLNDSAVAAQQPYQDPQQEIVSHTISTATDIGWIWDIGLQNRRGTGHVFSSKHASFEQAKDELKAYLGDEQEQLSYRHIQFKPGHHKTFWHKNCVAIGMSAGFIEPLEASALALIEQGANLVANQLPQDRSHMQMLADIYNHTMLRHWQDIIEFLKLHYVLSTNDSDYWQAQKHQDSIPTSLQQKLALWRYQLPHVMPNQYNYNLFPSASYLYVLLGMGWQLNNTVNNPKLQAMANQSFNDNVRQTNRLLSMLPSNRQLLNHLTNNQNNKSGTDND